MLNKNKQPTVRVDAQTKSHEQLRKELWIGVATAVARAEASRSKEVPGRWADQALQDFDKAFAK